MNADTSVGVTVGDQARWETSEKIPHRRSVARVAFRIDFSKRTPMSPAS